MPANLAHKLVPSKVQDELDAAKQSIGDAVETADAKARKVSEAAMQELSVLAANLNSRLKDLGISAEEMLDETKEGAVSLQRKMVEEVAAHPLRSLAIAAGLGLAFGLLSRK